MNAQEIERLLRADPATRGIFRGVCAYDEIPDHVTTWPAAYVFNTEPSHMKGEHWIAVYLESPTGRAEHFDSYGTHPHGNIYDFLHRHSKRILYNHKWIQGPLTRVCGQYCIYYLHFRGLGWSLEEIVDHFDQYDWTNNDQLVQAFVEHVMEPDD